MTRLKPRTDANQSAVIDALRAYGASVCSLAGRGKGVPDLLVGFRGKNLLYEVKSGENIPSKRKLTPDQVKWHADWEGTVHVVEWPEEAVDILRE